MFKSTSFITEYKLHKSVSHRHAVGGHLLSYENVTYGMFQNNILIKRWNKKASQANVYLLSGIGAELVKPQLVSHLGVQSDWETRQLYAQFNLDGYVTNQSFAKGMIRLGASPFKTSFYQGHYWFIIQCDYMYQSDDITAFILPVIRFFKHQYLVEFGSNFKDDYHMVFMIHF